MSGETSGPESSNMLTTDAQHRKATLHERIEHDRSEIEQADQPAHSSGSGTTRIASLIAASKARDNKGD